MLPFLYDLELILLEQNKVSINIVFSMKYIGSTYVMCYVDERYYNLNL